MQLALYHPEPGYYSNLRGSARTRLHHQPRVGPGLRQLLRGRPSICGTFWAARDHFASSSSAPAAVRWLKPWCATCPAGYAIEETSPSLRRVQKDGWVSCHHFDGPPHLILATRSSTHCQSTA